MNEQNYQILTKLLNMNDYIYIANYSVKTLNVTVKKYSMNGKTTTTYSAVAEKCSF